MTDPLRIGITCYPSVGGSGVLATTLGEELAARGHDVHFIAYERPFRLPADAPRLHFHPVTINEYGLFRFPDYTLPLSVRMAEVSRDHRLDVLHVHYAVPHATAALLAVAMLPPAERPRVVSRWRYIRMDGGAVELPCAGRRVPHEPIAVRPRRARARDLPRALA